jgi:DSF synthase
MTHDLLQHMEQWGGALMVLHRRGMRNIHVLQSARRDVFSLGGDLDLFARCVLAGDRETLAEYALSATALVYEHLTGWDGRYNTISLVSGQCLGGGLEAALGAQYVVVEEGATLQFPESRFGLWPGMGAEALLVARGVDGDVIGRMVHQGELLDLEALLAAGVIDRIATRDEMDDYRDPSWQHKARTFSGWVESIRPAHQPSWQSMHLDTLRWVDAALKLPKRDVRLMQAIARRQMSRFGS